MIENAIKRQKIARQKILRKRDTQLNGAIPTIGHKLTILEDKEKQIREQQHQVEQQIQQLDNQTGADNQTHKAHQLERRYQDLGRKGQKMPSSKGQKTAVDALKQKQLATTARSSRAEI